MFNTNIKTAVSLLIPTGLRRPRLMAWASALVSLVEKLRADFAAYRQEKLFLLAHNSQVVYLEHILNYYLNPDGTLNDTDYEGNGIYISEGVESDALYIYNRAEEADDTFLHNNSEAPFAQVYLNQSSAFVPVVGFVINVPTPFAVDEYRLRALVNRLKLAGKLYTIRYYDLT